MCSPPTKAQLAALNFASQRAIAAARKQNQKLAYEQLLVLRNLFPPQALRELSGPPVKCEKITKLR